MIQSECETLCSDSVQVLCIAVRGYQSQACSADFISSLALDGYAVRTQLQIL